MKIVTRAPSNIALIKYMGKTKVQENRPTNISLSYTLEHLFTTVSLEPLAKGHEDSWAPMATEGSKPIQLSDKGRARFLAHFSYLKNQMGLSGSFAIQSINNFPSDCGLASSASSFAALTQGAYLAAHPHKTSADLTLEERELLSRLSRAGSGSSCRSFFTPWALWREDGAEPFEVNGPFEKLDHMVVVAESGVKAVSSSQAHVRVASSSLFKGRAERAETRATDLMEGLRSGDWQSAFDIVWAEFWDMHALFETSQPPFGYMTSSSMAILQWTRDFWTRHEDGPLVTMDAGPNVHFLFRRDQEVMYQQFKDRFQKDYAVWGVR